jgi:hypothetical protein
VRARPPDVGEARDVGHLVEHPGGQENRARQLDTISARNSTGAVEHLRALGFEGHDLDAVPRQLRAAAGTQLRRVQPVVAQDAVHLNSGLRRRDVPRIVRFALKASGSSSGVWPPVGLSVPMLELVPTQGARRPT